MPATASVARLKHNVHLTHIHIAQILFNALTLPSSNNYWIELSNK